MNWLRQLAAGLMFYWLIELTLLGILVCGAWIVWRIEQLLWFLP
jgi:hypothetical protein